MEQQSESSNLNINQNVSSEQPIKRKRGRPKKILTPEEQAAKEAKKNKKPKLTLAEKQEIKLHIQKLKEAEQKRQGKPRNTENYYCTNRDLQNELIKWYESAEQPEDRIISEDLGKMFMQIGNKLLNHSNFRNYSKELKEDMLGYFLFKIIKGLKNYNFKFSNPFAFVTMAAWNAYLSVINKHYKQMNIKKNLMKKMVSELETYSGISPNTSLNKFIKTYLGDEFLTEE